MSTLRTLGFAICLTLLSPVSWAGRPFTTEDAGVLAARDCELEAFGARLGARDEPLDRGGWGQLNCGVGIQTQLAVGAGRFESGDELRTITAVAGKTALRPLTDDSVGVALAYSLEGMRPSGRSMRHAGSTASLVISIPHGQTIVHGNLGIGRNHLESKTSGLYALAIERVGEQGVDVGVEIYGSSRESPWLGTGARYAIEADKLWADFSFAAQTGGGDARYLTVGLKYAF